MKEYDKLFNIAKEYNNFYDLVERLKKEKSKNKLLSDYYLRIQNQNNIDQDILLTPTGKISSKSDRRFYDYGFVVNDFLITTKLKVENKNEVRLKDILEDNVDDKYFLSKEKTNDLIKNLDEELIF